MKRIRLLLIMDGTLLRECLAKQLAQEPDLEIVAECATPGDGLGALGRAAVDLVLLDGPDGGASFITAARAAGYQGKVLILAAAMPAIDLARSLRAGASGIFLKDKTFDNLLAAVRLVAGGGAWLDPEAMRLLASATENGNAGVSRTLTDREQRVLEGVIDGLTNQKIAALVGLSEASVKAALRQIFEKKGVKTRCQLVRAVLSHPGAVTIHHAP